MNNINVVYTPWANLKKTGDMDVGQIGFHRQRDVSNVTNHLTASTRVQVELTSKCFHAYCAGEDGGGGEKGQRDRKPAGENKSGALPRPGGGEGVQGPRGEK